MKGLNIPRKRAQSTSARGSDPWKLAAILGATLAVLWMIKGDPGAVILTLVATGFVAVKGWAIGAGVSSVAEEEDYWAEQFRTPVNSHQASARNHWYGIDE